MTSARTSKPSGDRLVVATRNPGKLIELRTLLGPAFENVVDLRTAGVDESDEEADLEDGTTFEANAVAKARYFAARTNGLPVLADDSGLCVRALGGAPGVFSRRYAGAVGTDAEVAGANAAKLLSALATVADRGAWFACAVAYVAPGREMVATGRTDGRILDAPRGTEGFGYDPLFWSDELARSFGEASPAEKARVSHRARAVRQLLAGLRAEPARVAGVSTVTR